MKKRIISRRKPLALEIGQKLATVIDEAGLSKEEAAIKLDISRQQLHAYIEGLSYPGGDVLCKAFVEWPELYIDYDDHHQIRVKVNRGGGRTSKMRSSHQLKLPLTFDVEPTDLAVTLRKRGPQSVHLRVSVKVQR